jgi:hypothetical protein
MLKQKRTIMKKIYINPVMNVVKIETQQMLAASGEVGMKSGNATEWGARSCDDFDCED